MARLEKLDQVERKHLEALACPTFDSHSFVSGPALGKRRVAIVSPAGLHCRGDRPFTLDPGDAYRVIPADIEANDLVMSHVSTNFDHTGFQQDWNVVFPIDRLHDLVAHNKIGSVADFHYSFMGAIDPLQWEEDARRLAGILKKDAVDAVLLLPV